MRWSPVTDFVMKFYLYSQFILSDTLFLTGSVANGCQIDAFLNLLWFEDISTQIGCFFTFFVNVIAADCLFGLCRGCAVHYYSPQHLHLYCNISNFLWFLWCFVCSLIYFHTPKSQIGNTEERHEMKMSELVFFFGWSNYFSIKSWAGLEVQGCCSWRC